MLVWFAGPALLGLLATLTSYSPFTTDVRFVGLANYAAVLRDPQFATAARNVGLLTLFAVPLELTAGFAIAWLLRRPLRGRAALRVLLLLPWLVSPIASGVMWHFLLSTTSGIADFFLGWLGAAQASSPAGDLHLALPAVVAIEVWRVAPFVAFLLLPGLESIPRERWDEATLAGASVFGRIFRVAVPGMRGLLLTVSMLLVGLALGTFDTILILTGGGPGTAPHVAHQECQIRHVHQREPKGKLPPRGTADPVVRIAPVVPNTSKSQFPTGRLHAARPSANRT